MRSQKLSTVFEIRCGLVKTSADEKPKVFEIRCGLVKTSADEKPKGREVSRATLPELGKASRATS